MSTARFRGPPETVLGQNGQNGPLWGHLLKKTAIFPFLATLDPRPLSPPCAMGSEMVWALRAPFGVSTNTVSPKSEPRLEKSGWSKIAIFGEWPRAKVGGPKSGVFPLSTECNTLTYFTYTPPSGVGSLRGGWVPHRRWVPHRYFVLFYLMRVGLKV